MADIFVSYSRADRDAVEPIVKALEAEGWEVWWDTRLIAGEQWDEVIEREIHAAACVVVVWSPVSVARRWVRIEANFGLTRNILVPVAIGGATPPLAFSLTQAEDLSGWDGSATAPAFRRAVSAIREALRRTPGPAPDYPVTPDAGMETPAVAPGNAVEEWKLIEHSADPRDFRLFIEEHKAGFLVRKARHGLEDLAEEALAAAGRDAPALERFVKVYFDSVHADAARAILAEIAAEVRARQEEERKRREQEERVRAEEEQRKRDEAARLQALKAEEERKRQEAEARYRAEGRIRVPAALVRPAGLEWFLPGAGKAEGFKDAEFAPEMVVVPAGSFTMGSPADEPERYGDEGPRHKVTIASPFAIGRFAITFAEWDAAQADKDWQAITGRAPKQPGDEGWGRGDRPVVNVDWDDAEAYAKWLSSKTGKHYRLSSEAEREYVTRAGTTTAFWWGKSIAPEQANYDGTADPYKGGGEKGEYRQKTLPVKSFGPNPWGLYQVHGNVWEWCEDLWHDDYNGAPQDGSAWITGGSGRRVLRGGSWASGPGGLRAAAHVGDDPGGRGSNVGLRLARTF